MGGVGGLSFLSFGDRYCVSSLDVGSVAGSRDTARGEMFRVAPRDLQVKYMEYRHKGKSSP